VPDRDCEVSIADAAGRGNHWYSTKAATSFGAARQAIDRHEREHKVTLTDDVMVTVIPDGIGPLLHGFSENSKLPHYRHTVGQVKART
jgi:hypothetical protein